METDCEISWKIKESSYKANNSSNLAKLNFHILGWSYVWYFLLVQIVNKLSEGREPTTPNETDT